MNFSLYFVFVVSDELLFVFPCSSIPHVGSIIEEKNWHCLVVWSEIKSRREKPRQLNDPLCLPN